jgi:hypothetical protein
MGQAFRAGALVPGGFVVEETSSIDAELLIAVRSIARASACPGCGAPSEGWYRGAPQAARLHPETRPSSAWG